MKLFIFYSYGLIFFIFFVVLDCFLSFFYLFSEEGVVYCINIIWSKGYIEDVIRVDFGMFSVFGLG